MARYDRIARLDPPSRARAFPGWLVLRDLDGRDRDAELGRRARIRFLALRPLRRLLDAGFDDATAPSLERQLDRVRHELDRLGTRDPERIRINAYLREVGSRVPRRAAIAAMTMGEAVHAAGHIYAAEEFLLTGLAIAETHRLDGQRVRSLRSLGRLYGDRAEWDHARECLQTSAAAAEKTDDELGWGRALAVLAVQSFRAGDRGGARSLIASVAERGARHEQLEPLASAGLCAIELMEGRTEAAIEAGWLAIERLPTADEERTRVLFDLGAAFRGLRLRAAAESCYRIVIRSSAGLDAAVTAQVEHAVAAAEVGDVDAFEARRTAWLDGSHRGEAHLEASAHLGLGRGAMMVDQIDDARDHVRQAMSIARAAGLPAVITRAEELLSSLEQRVDLEMRSAPPTPTDTIRTIAGRIESLGQAIVAAG